MILPVRCLRRLEEIDEGGERRGPTDAGGESGTEMFSWKPDLIS